MGTPTRGAQALPSDRSPRSGPAESTGTGHSTDPKERSSPYPAFATRASSNVIVLPERQRLETEGDRERSPVDDAPGDVLLELLAGDGDASISPRRFEGIPLGSSVLRFRESAVEAFLEAGSTADARVQA